MYNDNNQIKENNRNRFIYSFLFIILLVLISIMYASLAINFGVKVKTPKIIEPKEKPIEEKVVEKEEPVVPSKPTKKPITKRIIPTVPVIVPNNINWKIEFNNLKVKTGSVDAVKEAYILPSKSEINYEVIFTTPGEFYSFDMDVINKGNVDAKIYDIIETGISGEEMRFLEYKVTYSDGTPISKNDVLNARNKKKIVVLLKFREDIDPEDLPDGGQDFKLSYKLVYVQK